MLSPILNLLSATVQQPRRPYEGARPGGRLKRRWFNPEHDGIVSTRYHRGVHRAVRRRHHPDHELDALPNGIASASRANPTPEFPPLDAKIAAQPASRGPSSNAGSGGQRRVRRTAAARQHPASHLIPQFWMTYQTAATT